MWKPEDAILVRAMVQLVFLGYEPDVAWSICNGFRREISRGEGWLVLTRGFDFSVLCVGMDGAVVRGGSSVLTRKEDVQVLLARLIDAGMDVCQAVLVDLRRLREKSELSLAHFKANARPRGRPRKHEVRNDS
jgi:hypothetical protein